MPFQVWLAIAKPPKKNVPLKTSTAKLEITSLNLHLPHLRLSTKYGEYSEVEKCGVCNSHFHH
jgi:hypothetical protein